MITSGVYRFRISKILGTAVLDVSTKATAANERLKYPVAAAALDPAELLIWRREGMRACKLAIVAAVAWAALS
ncbi:hypothetical protein MNEG_7507, partial [Monoraphidium neglectum]